mmetsp:Transcript_41669/g.109749  ORF Transcript_41669/g.109749 Transcript_41669/m.109749 type:complete len:228 (+) Transcript_41669:230-913(+)
MCFPRGCRLHAQQLRSLRCQWRIAVWGRVPLRQVPGANAGTIGAAATYGWGGSSCPTSDRPVRRLHHPQRRVPNLRRMPTPDPLRRRHPPRRAPPRRPPPRGPAPGGRTAEGLRRGGVQGRRRSGPRHRHPGPGGQGARHPQNRAGRHGPLRHGGGRGSRRAGGERGRHHGQQAQGPADRRGGGRLPYWGRPGRGRRHGSARPGSGEPGLPLRRVLSRIRSESAAGC